ncbi:membrane-spanning 4-domains subfamily A member 15-like [Channa argus]|uniref:membrane-spanning 4-domains subfamily A member 15-like n=1 Tax=Channa argus TaxID=215402 RepID=UPI003520D1BF
MSVEFHPASGPGGNNASLQGTTVGGSKPLHRFLKGQPKIVGTIMVPLGLSFFIVSITVGNKFVYNYDSTTRIPVFWMGAMFIICGILFILTENNLTKKTVTLSLALSIVAILSGFCCASTMIFYLTFFTYRRRFYYDYKSMEFCLEVLFLFYTLVSIVIFITMSSLAGAALRSTRSQAIVVMTTMPTQTPAE